MACEESRRLEQTRTGVPWRRWGPYLAERQWGTVREDYSASGDAWSYFTHDQARSRAYHWGEDGLAGISDDQQLLCFALALWNGADPILKERLFGLTNAEGNHGEDVKEYYFYLDSTPTHSYMKYLYKYPQRAYPYADLVATNRSRPRTAFEYELIDTHVFDDGRYFDVFVEYAKAAPDDLLIRITAHNRGPDPATLHVLPTIWFRRIWRHTRGNQPAPILRDGDEVPPVIAAFHPLLGEYLLYAEGAGDLLFTGNETNTSRLFNRPNDTPYVKDGINDCIVGGHRDRVNPEKRGTKAAAHYLLTIQPGKSASIRLRLCTAAAACMDHHGPFGLAFDTMMETRRQEADAFYASITPASFDPDAARVMRQAFAGLLWSKQYYYYDVDRWLEEHGADPFGHSGRAAPRNEHWHHMYNAHIISMPDKWEYPWYAAWDLAFHVIPLNLIDPDLGKQQLDLMLSERYLHPSGQIPAYEWNFGDVNPPVHAWSTIYTYRLDARQRGSGDVEWLERTFHKLLLNFTWWVNRKDRSGNNAFEGGFLGLDNIGVFDRSKPLPTGGYLEQADGTAWMAFYCQNMVEIAAELAAHRPAYKEMGLKFIEHFFWIAAALARPGDSGMWDEADGFFYDVLRLPDGRSERLKVRSMVGLLPFCAVTVYDGRQLARSPELLARLRSFLGARPELRSFIHDPTKVGQAGRRLGAILDERKLRRVLARMLDEREFLSPYGIRSLSRHHLDHPYRFRAGDQDYCLSYVPAESDSGMFGGNSNWRGPIWMPVNALILRALYHYYRYYGDAFTIECPTGSGRQMTLYEIAGDITRRLTSIFLRNADGRRPVYGGARTFQDDPHWRDLLLFYEYFHGDNGAGLGASHQTGWTADIAALMHLRATMSAEQVLADEARVGVTPLEAVTAGG